MKNLKYESAVMGPNYTPNHGISVMWDFDVVGCQFMMGTEGFLIVFPDAAVGSSDRSSQRLIR